MKTVLDFAILTHTYCTEKEAELHHIFREAQLLILVQEVMRIADL